MFRAKTVKKRPGVLGGLLSFFYLCMIILCVRWIIFEVFVIPSSSMYPKLYINDYLIVSKYDFGIRVPFTSTWVLGPYLPERNSIVVFLSKDESKYYIKRLVGKPGDKITVAGDFIIELNDKPVEHVPFSKDEEFALSEKTGISFENFDAYYEKGSDFERVVLVEDGAKPPSEWSKEERENLSETFTPPPGYVLFMGDNRHRSHDGRYFGYMPQESLIGLSRFIALSCESKDVGTGCDLTRIRKNRILMGTSQ